jgi:hypothetical protein
VALRYAGEFSGFRVAAGIGYIDNGSGANEVSKDDSNGPFPSVWKGSASVLHVASGLFLTGAYVDRDNDVSGRPNTTLWYVQGGIAKNWTGLGNTVLYGEWAEVNDGGIGTAAGNLANADSTEANMWGIGVVQHIDAAAMELYLSYRQYSGSADGIANGDNIDDFNVVVGGARVRF